MFPTFSKYNTKRLFRRRILGVFLSLTLSTSLLSPALLFAEEASTTSEVSTPTPAPAVVETGNAAAGTDVTNTVNTNQTTPIPQSSTELASTTPATGGDTTVGATSTNDATVGTTASTTVATGDNAAAATAGAEIFTGDAYAGANVVNVVNANIFDSDTLLLFLNNLFGGIGEIDLRPYLEGFGDSSFPCNLCGFSSSLSASTTNTANVSNDIFVSAASGGNHASSTDGLSVISTGNAFAEANVVNVVNTNLVDAGYLLMVFNNFGNWEHDLVLPGADLFARLFASTATGSPRTTTLSNTNDATVANSLATGAATGDNTASGTSTAVMTGDAMAASTVVNEVNQNLLNTSSFKILFRIHGNWTGNVFGLPPGLTWSRTPFGLQIVSSAGGSASGTCCASSTLSVQNTNHAFVNNNVSVYALTGANEASGHDAVINTGHAAAVSNVVNLVNTNIIGRNWLLAIVNIFGDWNGNITFGRPDLWMATRVESVGGVVGPSSDVIYHFTVANRGDAQATHVRLTDIFDQPFLSFNDGNTRSPQEVYFDLGTIASGEARTFSFGAHVSNDLPYGETNIANNISVSSFEPDADLSNNTDRLSLLAFRNFPSTGGGTFYTPDPVLSVTKQNDVAPDAGLFASSTVHYAVTIKNTGGPAYHAYLEDTLKDAAGRRVSYNTWDLDTIYPSEEITVNYTVFFNASSSPGTYTNFAQVRSVSRSPSLEPFLGYFADSNIASSSVLVIGTAGEVGGGAVTAIEPSLATPPEETTVLLVASSTTSSVIERTPRPSHPEVKRGEDGKPVFFFDIPGGGNAISSVPVSSSGLASVFTALRRPWSREFDFLVFIAIVVLVYLTQDSFPRYRAILRSFFSL